MAYNAVEKRIRVPHNGGEDQMESVVDELESYDFEEHSRKARESYQNQYALYEAFASNLEMLLKTALERVMK
jgi:hypothetical protein